MDEGAHDLDDPDVLPPAETECPRELDDQEHMAMAAFHKAKARVLEVCLLPEARADDTVLPRAPGPSEGDDEARAVPGVRSVWPLEPGQGMSQERPGFSAERREVCAFRVVHAACRFDGRLRRFERSPHVGDGDIFPCFSRAQRRRHFAVGSHRTQC